MRERQLHLSIDGSKGILETHLTVDYDQLKKMLDEKLVIAFEHNSIVVPLREFLTALTWMIEKWDEQK